MLIRVSDSQAGFQSNSELEMIRRSCDNTRPDRIRSAAVFISPKLFAGEVQTSSPRNHGTSIVIMCALVGSDNINNSVEVFMALGKTTMWNRVMVLIHEANNKGK